MSDEELHPDPDVEGRRPARRGARPTPEGSSGAEEGISPWAPEAYDDEGEGPTSSTEE